MLKKELTEFITNKGNFITLIAPIILFLAVFVLAATKDVENIDIIINIGSSSHRTTKLVEKIESSTTFRPRICYGQQNEIPYEIDKEKALIGIDISDTNSIQINMDGRRTNSATIATGYVNELINRYQIANSNISKSMPEVSVRSWYNPNKNQKWFSITNLVCMIVISQAIALTALSIVREKEQGTFDQLLVAPISPIGMLIGKALPSVIISLFMGACVMFIGSWIYGVPIRGSLFLMTIAMIVYVISVVGIGVCIAAFSNTQQQAMLGTFIVQMPIASLSGLMTPVESIDNPIMRAFTKINPMVYGNNLVKGIMLKDMTFVDAMSSIIPLIFIGLFVICVACFIFSKKHKIKIF